ncbi:MAG: ATP-grasp domain-containing protein [Burkholderiaceae bacterium]|nr:ATP-grasp domain-containing protein [Burkholderiaceae bacterium]
MGKVLILGGRAPVALDHARRFAHQGWDVFVSDSVPCRLSGWSNAVKDSISLTSARYDPRAFVKELSVAVTRHKIDLIVPTCEEVFFLSRYRDALPKLVAIAVDDFEKLRLLHSKWKFQDIARECGGNPPRSILVRTIEQAREWFGVVPLVLKPEYSRFGVHVRIHPNGVPVNEAELGDFGDWVAQEYVSGTELCSYSIAYKGRLTAHCVYHPRHRLGKSSSFYFAPREAAGIRKFVEKFVTRIGFTGQISFDWIESVDGKLSVIECNPRAISGVHLFSLNDQLPAALNGNAMECVVPSEAKPRMLASVMLTAGLFQCLKAGNFAGWKRDLQMASDVLMLPSDRLPILGAARDIVSFARLAVKNQCSLREAATRDIEWDGQELAEI